MLDAFRFWLNLRGKANFWDWVRDNFSMSELQELAEGSIDCNLVESYNPLGELTIDQYIAQDSKWRTAIKMLYRRYGGDIWHACLAGFDASQDKTVFSCFARLDLAEQVNSPKVFEEFLFRNALKTAARKILEEKATKS
ncbi:MAG: hypothetical protein V7641_1113 [Blastocatellia bacterium]